jgi:CheY-like chemotaxis protein
LLFGSGTTELKHGPEDQMSTILLADDSLTIQKVVELTFADTSYAVVAVSSGEELLEKLPECQPDLVICDVIMPGKDGYEVCQEIKSTPATLHIPVILLTGTFEPFDRDRALAAGCSEIITKPFEARKLVETVEELLGGAAPAAAPAAEEVPTQFDATTPAGFDMSAAEQPAPAAAGLAEPTPAAPEPEPPVESAEEANSGLDFTTSGFAEMEAAAVDEHEMVPEAPQEGLEFDLGGEQPPEPPPAYDTAPVEPVPSPETQPVMMPEAEELSEPEVEFAELPDEPGPPHLAEAGEAGAGIEELPPPTLPTFEPAPPGIEPELEYELPAPESVAAAEPVAPAVSFELPEPEPTPAAEPPAFAGTELEAAESFELPVPESAPVAEPPAFAETEAEVPESFELPPPEPTAEAEPSVSFEAVDAAQAEIPAPEPELAPPVEDAGAPSIPAFEAEPPKETEAGPAMPFELPPPEAEPLSAEPVAEAEPAMPFELPQPEAEPTVESATGFPEAPEAGAVPPVEEPTTQPDLEEPPLVFEPAEPEVDAFPPPPMEAAPAELGDAFAAPTVEDPDVVFDEAPPIEQDSAEVAFPPPPMEADEEQVFEEPSMPPPAEPTTDIFAAPPEPAAEPGDGAFPSPTAEPPAAEPPAPMVEEAPASAEVSSQGGAGLSEADVDRIARRVLELSGGKIEEIAWEVIPDMAEIVVRERVRELESSAEGSETVQ